MTEGQTLHFRRLVMPAHSGASHCSTLLAIAGSLLRDLYRTLKTPGADRLRDAQVALDIAVCAAYGISATYDILAFLIKLNLELADNEAKGASITTPGLPSFVPDPGSLVSEDCVKIEEV